MHLLFGKQFIKGYCFDKLILLKQIPLRIRCLKILLELVLKWMSKFIVKKRSSRGVLGNFEKFTGKHLCQSSFFKKVDGLRFATLLKKRLWHEYFPVYFCKIFNPFRATRNQCTWIQSASRTYIYVIRCQKKISRHAKNTFFIEHPQWLLLSVNFLESLLLNYIYLLNILLRVYNFITSKITRSLNIAISDGIYRYSCFKK